MMSAKLDRAVINRKNNDEKGVVWGDSRRRIGVVHVLFRPAAQAC